MKNLKSCLFFSTIIFLSLLGQTLCFAKTSTLEDHWSVNRDVTTTNDHQENSRRPSSLEAWTVETPTGLPHLIGQGHQAWNEKEQQLLRHLWSDYVEKNKSDWFPTVKEWESIEAKIIFENGQTVLMVGKTTFDPAFYELNGELLKKFEEVVEAKLDYGPSLIDLLVARYHASLLARSLAIKLFFTFAALEVRAVPVELVYGN